MTANWVFKLHESGVASEHFDNEVILLNLSRGNYYSIRDTGFELWDKLINGANREQMVQFLSTRYDADTHLVEKDVSSFIDQLLNEGLITMSENIDAVPLPLMDPQKAPIPYTKPELEVYSDMQDILMLDPIHDVDSEQGWPIRK